MSFQPSATLRSRTYLGLIVAQFLAAFNDQAIHIVAIFYAIGMLVEYAHVGPVFGFLHLGASTVIALVTACFITPFALFSPLAGMLADRYSKRNIILVWKLAEVGITGLALAAFLLPHTADLGWGDLRTLTTVSALLVVGCVFLMGLHSTFFVPAKYGIMPEILQHTILSQGNGFLESTSFVAQIFGTVFGAALYSSVQSTVDKESGALTLGHEWVVGAVLLGLAGIGAVCSFLIERVPPAAPDRPLTWKLWQPLSHNLGVLLRSRPLALSVVGIAFFAGLVLYSRQTLLYASDVDKDLAAARETLSTLQKNNPEATVEQETSTSDLVHPQSRSAEAQAELTVAILIALVGFGIGLGSPLAGYLSGNKVELGLVPIGLLFLIGFAIALAFLNQRFWGTVTSLVLIGVAAGFYIVPLYTLLQHRAPKDSKGNLVATSNFINVLGGLVAIGVFLLLTGVLERMLDLDVAPASSDLPEHRIVAIGMLIKQLQIKRTLTRILFLAASMMTAGVLLLLCCLLPDFFTRALLWLRSLTRYRLHVIGLNNLPSEGPVILATNCERPESCLQVLAATDRSTRFILVENSKQHRLGPILRSLTRLSQLAVLQPGTVQEDVLQRTLASAVRVLGRGDVVGLPADSHTARFDVDRFLHALRDSVPDVPVLPVYCSPSNGDGAAEPGRNVYVVIDHPWPADTPAHVIRSRIHSLGAWIAPRVGNGKVDPTTLMIPGASDASPTTPATDLPGLP